LGKELELLEARRKELSKLEEKGKTEIDYL